MGKGAKGLRLWLNFGMPPIQSLCQSSILGKHN